MTAREDGRTLPCGWPGPPRPAEEWCIHELSPGTCSICTGLGEEIPDVPDPADYGPWFTARLHSGCAGKCGRPIVPGDRIRADGTSGYLCEDCGTP